MEQLLLKLSKITAIEDNYNNSQLYLAPFSLNVTQIYQCSKLRNKNEKLDDFFLILEICQPYPNPISQNGLFF